MANKEALMMGDSEIHQLIQIFKICGTPTDEVWPGVSQLPDYNPTFPKFKARNLAEICPSLGPDGIDLLSKMLQLDPAKRISCKAALEHPYFSSFVARFKDRL